MSIFSRTKERSGRVAAPAILAGMLTVLAGCGPAAEPPPEAPVDLAPEKDALAAPPPAFEEVPVPADNPMTLDKVALGRQLFFDKRLSGDGSRSCYSCHVCENGLTDGLPTAVGAYGKALPRSSPTLWNIGYHTEYYWDGRSASLEAQAVAAWKGGNMGADPNAIVETLNGIPGYREQFKSVFASEATPENVTQAISAYERTVFCGTTAWDRFNQGDTAALGESARRGWDIWREKAGCGSCHAGILFTDLQYHNVGIGMSAETTDVGRGKVTGEAGDTGAFKTPTLRDIAKSGPYFHDGSAATLEEAVDIMLAGGIDNPHIDRKNLQPVTLTDAEKADLIAFLESLSCECTLKEPALP